MSLPPTACLYLHGFLSSPASGKAQEVLHYYREQNAEDRVCIPALPFEPVVAIAQAAEHLQALQQRFEQVFVIGSSLGGFYATWLAQQHGVRAVLVNPAVRPHELFQHYIGPVKHYYTDEIHELTPAHLEQLAAIAVTTIAQPQNLLVMLQTGDETLDYRHAEELYRGCPRILEQGGSHTFDGFIDHMPTIQEFAASGRLRVTS